jgi:predicted ATPase
MQFYVEPTDVSVSIAHPKESIKLVAATWNDWFTYRTLFSATYKDTQGFSHSIGTIKIAKRGHAYSDSVAGATPLPPQFSELSAEFISIVQDEDFYAKLHAHVPLTQVKPVLRALRDGAMDIAHFESFLREEFMSSSLLRFVSPVTVRTSYPRYINGGGNVAYSFSYVARLGEDWTLDPVKLNFEVEPESTPPTNVHVIIGRNGAGKTTLLSDMAKSILARDYIEDVGHFNLQDGRLGHDFANLVYVSFSAFDSSTMPVEDIPSADSTPYSYIGLQEDAEVVGEHGKEKIRRNLSPDGIAARFAVAAQNIANNKDPSSWLRALRVLESDPNFRDHQIASLADAGRRASVYSDAMRLWESTLSSGHKIVLLAITRLVEAAQERTLVLIDEPEAHLHPPLLSAFTRALSELMQEKNSVTILATHSPVVLQEVPRKCVYTISRIGDQRVASRPDRETFGENVGTLTHAVFGLEVEDSGFLKLLVDKALQLHSYERVLAEFNDELGFEARATLRAWFANNDREDF